MSDSAPSRLAAPIQQAALQQALEWLVTVWSNEASDAEMQDLARWRAASAEHERAWQKVQRLDKKLLQVPTAIASSVLRAAPKSIDRRSALRALGLLLIAGPTSYVVKNSDAWRSYRADFRTAVGERRDVTLSDGTNITLNTSTAIDVEFTDFERRVVLREGEILVATAHDGSPMHRRFIVQTRHGTVEALGTRFVVRRTEAWSRATVLESAINIQPVDKTVQPLKLEAAREASFTENAIQDLGSAQLASSAWASGMLVADRMQLSDFLAELSRYRPGLIRCDAAIGKQIVSGVYPLNDIDRILRALPDGLPVRVSYATPYWVTVHAR